MEDKDKLFEVDYSQSKKHNLPYRIGAIIVKIVHVVWGFIKNPWKLIAAIFMVGVLIFVGKKIYASYQEYQDEQAYKRHVAELEYKLDDFSQPDSVYKVSDEILRNSEVVFVEGGVLSYDSYKDRAIENMMKLADQGHARAQFTLGLYYEGYDFDTGKFSSEDISRVASRVDWDKSAYWYLQAAKQGNGGAMNNLGTKYSSGNGVPKNEEKAVYWFRRATEYGNSYGPLNLGDYFRYGLRVRSGSHEEPILYNGNFYGRYRTVIDYRDVIVANIDSAMYYWELADERGCPKAKERIQKIYE